ncbi:hypothetical protein KC799_19750, partial [candidate division KSB1 bacterium]|nr:hypothetical protein [candidate division KSB1 bacterium]
MRVFQKNFPENSLATSFGQVVAFSVLFLLPEYEQFHPARSLIATVVFFTLTVLKIVLIFLGNGGKRDNTLAFILVILTGLFWSTIYLLELLTQPTLNPTVVVLYILNFSIMSAGSFALYKNAYLIITYFFSLPLLTMVYSFVFLTELSFVLGITMLIGVLFMSIYVKKHYDNWMAFVAEKAKSEQLADQLATQKNELVEKNEKLDMALAKAEEASVTKSLFLASMSHEIRTPMN